MMRPALLLFPVLLAVPVLAQKVEIKVQDPKQPEHFVIQTSFKTTDTRKMLRNGEESDFGGRGGRAGGGAAGAAGETTLTQDIEFEQGAAKDDYREYQKMTAVESRPGPDGEARETKTEGGLQGKKVFLKSDGKGALEMTEGKGDAAKPVPAALLRGAPGRVSFAGFAPTAAVAVGEEFDLSKSFLSAMRGVVHPVVADRGQPDNAAGQGGRGNRQGGAQGGRGTRQGGGRGGAGSTVLQLLSSDKLGVKATGKLLTVEQQGDEQIATLDVTAKLTGKGKAEDLGLPTMGNFGGRGARGGQNQNPPANPGTNNVDATFDVHGVVTVNLTQHRVTKVELEGNLAIERDTKNTMDVNGEETTIESNTRTAGKFTVKATCAAAGK